MKVELLVLRTSRMEELRRFYSSLGAQFEASDTEPAPITIRQRSVTTSFSKSTPLPTE